jgi:hypothetical protein
MSPEEENQNTRFIPVSEWPKHHPWPPVGGLRHLIFFAKTNGFDTVICRVGRRVLIDETKFFDFMRKKNEKMGVNND